MKDKGLHPKNKFNKGYDFKTLILQNPLLKVHVLENKHGITTIDFSDPKAVKELNKALLFFTINYLFGIFLMKIFVLQFLAD